MIPYTMAVAAVLDRKHNIWFSLKSLIEFFEFYWGLEKFYKLQDTILCVCESQTRVPFRNQ